MNTKLHAVTDTVGRPIRLFITAGQVSDYTGARALVESLPAADWLLGDRGYDADWFREALPGSGQASLQTTQPHRNNVRSPERRAKGRHPIRPAPKGIPVCNRTRRNHLVLVINQCVWSLMHLFNLILAYPFEVLSRLIR